jgi:hypothetical protein
MEILGTNFAITLGSWRLCFRIAVEDIDAPALPAKPQPAHHVRIVEEQTYARRASAN